MWLEFESAEPREDILTLATLKCNFFYICISKIKSTTLNVYTASLWSGEFKSTFIISNNLITVIFHVDLVNHKTLSRDIDYFKNKLT